MYVLRNLWQRLQGKKPIHGGSTPSLAPGFPSLPTPKLPTAQTSIEQVSLPHLMWEQARYRILLAVSMTVDFGFIWLWYWLAVKQGQIIDITQLASILDQTTLDRIQNWSTIGTLSFVALMIAQDIILFFIEILVSVIVAWKRLWRSIFAKH
jgi:hypothetical protein